MIYILIELRNELVLSKAGDSEGWWRDWHHPCQAPGPEEVVFLGQKGEDVHGTCPTLLPVAHSFKKSSTLEKRLILKVSVQKNIQRHIFLNTCFFPECSETFCSEILLIMGGISDRKRNVELKLNAS